MDEAGDMDNTDELLLPGFRFHPTDEELVGFYLKRKAQQKPLSIELIRQVNIYNYEPWDLPKLAATREKEWYFYCPRDRKYKNSTRPNRVTLAGFWKATGTDRPIYSSEASKCIGLKKSLVFYKGKAAKGVKTDWMMHEFRLPSLSDTVHQKRPTDKIMYTNDSWAICRIFKKVNAAVQSAPPNSWMPPLLFSTTKLDILSSLPLSTMDPSPTRVKCGSYVNLVPQKQEQHHEHPRNCGIIVPAEINYPNFDMPVQPKCSADINSAFLTMPQVAVSHAIKTPENLSFSQNHQQQQQDHCSFTGNLPYNSSLVATTLNSNTRWGADRNLSFPSAFGAELPSETSTAISMWEPINHLTVINERTLS